MKAKLNFIFNAHQPFVRHPEYPKFLEEDWYYEAVNESYIPLLKAMERLRADSVPFRLSFVVSPTLCCMFGDSLLSERFVAFLENRIELGHKEIDRLAGSPEQALAKLYTENLEENLRFFTEDCAGSLIGEFDRLSQAGCIELITSAATFAYFPLFEKYPVAVNAQVETGVMNHARTFSDCPAGFWLPDCGYYPGLEEILKRNNIKWTSFSAEAFLLADRKVKDSVYAPIRFPNGVWGFARDYNLTSLVWSSKVGYPCDTDYREFYRDIGYDLPMDYIRPYIHEPEVRVFTGFKYWKITGNGVEKEIYSPEAASAKVRRHVDDFIAKVNEQTAALEGKISDDPVYTLSFDAELFGHWWYEGPQWVECLARKVASSDGLSLVTSSDVIAAKPDVQTAVPGFCSWGTGGFSQVWVDRNTNTWMIRHIYKAIEQMTELADKFPDQASLKRRFLNQACREVLLLMASDWPLILHNHTNEGYASNRVNALVENINLVHSNVCRNAVNTEWLVNAEKRDNCFDRIDYNCFASDHMSFPSPVMTCDFDKERKAMAEEKGNKKKSQSK